MFHFAAPEVNGFAVITSTPGLDQVVPALDLLRVARADGEDDDRVRDDALVRLLVPVRRRRALPRRGSRRRARSRAGRCPPAGRSRPRAPGRPRRRTTGVKRDVLALRRLLPGLDDRAERLAGDGVADEAQRHVARAGGRGGRSERHPRRSRGRGALRRYVCACGFALSSLGRLNTVDQLDRD